MTAHTPPTPMWRKVLSLPQTLLGWLTVGLLIVEAVLWWVFPLVGMSLVLPSGHVLVGVFLLPMAAAALTGVMAWILGDERSIFVIAAMLQGVRLPWALSEGRLRPALGSGRSGTLIGVGPGLCELRRISIPRTPVNKGKRKRAGASNPVLHSSGPGPRRY